jgi:hypothetical protein
MKLGNSRSGATTRQHDLSLLHTFETYFQMYFTMFFFEMEDYPFVYTYWCTYLFIKAKCIRSMIQSLQLKDHRWSIGLSAIESKKTSPAITESANRPPGSPVQNTVQPSFDDYTQKPCILVDPRILTKFGHNFMHGGSMFSRLRFI